MGFLLVDGQLRACFGERDLAKTHAARLHTATRAIGETSIADGAAGVRAPPEVVCRVRPGVWLTASRCTSVGHG